MSENPTPAPGVEPPTPAQHPVSVATPSKAFWRTFVQVGLPALIGLVLILPAVIQDVIAGFGAQLPENFRVGLLGFAAALTLVSSILARVMANPKVLAWTVKYAPFLALPTK